MLSSTSCPACPQSCRARIPSWNGNANMNRRKLPGVASATKRLADGQLLLRLARRPTLEGRDGTPLRPSDPQFHVAYATAHAERRKPAAGTLFLLIASF